jgi:hypothetical protein
VPNKRYLNSFSIIYTPKFVKGLNIGIARGMLQYKKNLSKFNNFFNKYLPIIFSPLVKENNFGDDTLIRDQQASAFIRWIFPKEGFEFYGELGYNDYKLNLRDFTLNPTHANAYILGFKKLTCLNEKSKLDITFEITRMSQGPDSVVRSSGTWYEHGQILEGYTNQNQILGAGAGWGTNLQTLMVTKYQHKQSWSFWLEHLDRNPDNFVTRWNDWVIGIQHKRRYEKLFVDAQLQFVNSNNYAWEKGKNTFNLFARLGLTYIW